MNLLSMVSYSKTLQVHNEYCYRRTLMQSVGGKIFFTNLNRMLTVLLSQLMFLLQDFAEDFVCEYFIQNV